MRDSAPLHSVPNPDFAGELRGYRQQWTVPNVEDLARNRAPLYLPGDDPARDNPENSPWMPNYRNQMPLLPAPQSSLPGAVSDRRAGPASSSALLPAVAALGHSSVANGAVGRGQDALASRPAGPAVLFGLGSLPQAPGPGDQTGRGGLFDLLARLMASAPGGQVFPR
ncbi:hypothetical protein ACVIJ6_004437 [Bradyrhizobium sp. USDA 4369]